MGYSNGVVKWKPKKNTENEIKLIEIGIETGSMVIIDVFGLKQNWIVSGITLEEKWSAPVVGSQKLCSSH